ncbi:beta-lactamase family protein [Eubacteriales bacterium OttesenSCG-928-N13]|nr:beta-lactamase family protein [Eubacteriales bacterium OttesenSCG-928-N13]
MNTNKLRTNMDALLKGWTDSGALPCVQAIVSHRGQVVYEGAFGYADIEENRPIKSDAIFRAYSMSKGFTSTCMMMLHEQGKYKMHDPLSRFIPEYKNMKVAQADAAGHIDLVKPHREIVIRDLFTMASGIPYPGDGTPSERAMALLFNRMGRDIKAGKPWDTQRVAREVAKVPLTAHPGEHFWYGFSIDLLGALVEVLSGQKLGAFMREHIFEPLGLTDTAFYVPKDKQHRLVSAYGPDAKGIFTRKLTDDEFVADYLSPPAFESGGGGLVTTAQDMHRFTKMLAGMGQLDGVRLLSPTSVELMRTNHLSPEQMKDFTWDMMRGYGYGLALRTMLRPELAGYGSVGEFGWDGMMGTWFAADPKQQLAINYMVQINPGSQYEFIPNFMQTVYGSLDV